MNNITFVIFTYNEEKRISYVIRNFIKYGEVFIMDDGSTDRTKEISEKLGAKYFIRPKIDNIQAENQEMFNFVKSKVKADYIYWGYADNIAPKTLLEKLVEVSVQNKFKRIFIPLYTYLWGNVKNYALKSYTPFVFHKDFIDFADNHIHGMGKFLGTKEQLLKLPNKEEYALRHFSTYNLNKFVQAHLNYADIEALGRFQSGEKFSTIKMFIEMAKYYFWGRRAGKNGALVRIVSLNYAFFRLMVYTRLFELENNITLDSIEENYSKEKEKFLEEYK